MAGEARFWVFPRCSSRERITSPDLFLQRHDHKTALRLKTLPLQHLDSCLGVQGLGFGRWSEGFWVHRGLTIWVLGFWVKQVSLASKVSEYTIGEVDVITKVDSTFLNLPGTVLVGQVCCVSAFRV